MLHLTKADFRGWFPRVMTDRDSAFSWPCLSVAVAQQFDPAQRFDHAHFLFCFSRVLWGRAIWLSLWRRVVCVGCRICGAIWRLPKVWAISFEVPPFALGAVLVFGRKKSVAEKKCSCFDRVFLSHAAGAVRRGFYVMGDRFSRSACYSPLSDRPGFLCLNGVTRMAFL